MERIIGHLDMDAFFAAVEERENPGLVGLPVVVGADPRKGKRRGVVSTANYAARKYGIHSAMPISAAWRLSEDAKRKGFSEAVFLAPDFKKYSEASKKIMQILSGYSPVVQQTSVDEAYFDLSHLRNYGKAKEICRKLKAEIKRKEILTASVGIGPNKLIAKISSDAQKPDGLTMIPQEKVVSFLDPLPIRKIPGIGPKTEILFSKMRIRKVGDLKKYSREELTELLGKWGGELYNKVRGIDESQLAEKQERKSIGEQATFQKDTLNLDLVFKEISRLCQSIFERFKRKKFSAFRSVVITVRFHDFETLTHSQTAKSGQNSLKYLKIKALQLIMPYLDRRKNPRRKLIRLLGVRIEKLSY